MMDSRRYTIGLVLLGVTLITVALVVRLVVFGDEMTTLTEPVSQQFSTNDSPQIIVETFDGAIDVKLGGADQVAVTVVRKGSGLTESAAFDALGKVEVRMTQEGDTVRVRAWREEASPKLSSSGASVEMTVPAGSALLLMTSNGRVRTGGVVGEIIVHTSNGPILLSGVSSAVAATTSNGAVEITAVAPVSVSVETSNGNVSFTGSLANGAASRFVTSNASIRLALAAEAAYSIDARTTNGSITNDFPLVGGVQSKTRLLGDAPGNVPYAVLRAETTNGKIEVRRK